MRKALRIIVDDAYCLRSPKGSTSNPSEHVTELSEQVNKIMLACCRGSGKLSQHPWCYKPSEALLPSVSKLETASYKQQVTNKHRHTLKGSEAH